MSETTVTTEAQVDVTDDLDAFSVDFFGQKPAEPESTKTGAEQEETTEAEVEETEAQETEVDPEEDLEAELKEEPPKKKTVQDRINELVRQREDTKREADAQLAALRKEFEDYKKSQTVSDQPKTAEPNPADVNADGTPKYELGEFDPQYIRDLTRYTFTQERERAAAEAAQQQQATAQEQAQVTLQTEWNSKVEAATVEYPDFVEKGQEMLANFSNLDQNYAAYLSNVLMSMEKGPDVLYYLSNNPAEAVKIVNSGAQKATLALGRIEAKFIEADLAKQAAKPKVSKAPDPPPRKVQARGTNGAFISVAPDTDDLQAFETEFFRR